jgi:diphthine-ammonia ligase
MKTIALLSGGKDSILAVLMAYRYGHEPAVIVNIVPALPGEAETESTNAAVGHDIDSYMYQTVGFEAVDSIAACLQVPLRRACVKRGRAKDQSLQYSEHPPDDDEVESLFHLLKAVKAEFPEVQGLTSGAILSNYQRNRVEFICDRLGIESLAYLWMRQPGEILDMAHDLSVRAVLVKTASIGLIPRKLIGRTLEEARPTLEKITAMYQSHLAGEGGEYETTVLNCPLFRQEQLVVTSLRVVMQDENDISPSGHGVLTVERESKSAAQQAEDAALLRRLCNGELHFPSDVLPLLKTLSNTPQQLSWTEPSLLLPTTSGFSLLSGATREGVASCTYRGSAPVVPQMSAAEVQTCVYAAVTSCLAEAQVWVTTHHMTSFYYHLSLPSAVWESASRAAYSATVAHVCPPGLLITVRGSSSGGDAGCATAEKAYGEVVVEVLAAPSASIQTNVLHAQSRSCWALGEPGPYAQARRVGLADGNALVFVSATPGCVPATRTVATAPDLPEVCRARLHHFLQETADTAGEAAAAYAADADFAAEFLFAMANCQSYLAIYRHTLHDITRATILVTEAVTVLRLLPALWDWCLGEEAAPFSDVCTIATVSALSAGERVRVMVECVEANQKRSPSTASI